jgi:hypothetical protein
MCHINDLQAHRKHYSPSIRLRQCSCDGRVCRAPLWRVLAVPGSVALVSVAPCPPGAAWSDLRGAERRSAAGLQSIERRGPDGRQAGRVAPMQHCCILASTPFFFIRRAAPPYTPPAV